jgi:uncharacterized coiled-coil DUF342 family protein
MLKAIGAFVIGSILVLSACTRHKTLPRDGLRSEITSAKSLAAETETFLDYVGENRATKHYAEGHIEYLTEQIEQSRKELQESSAAQGEEGGLQELKAKFGALSTELHNIHGKLDDPAALATAKQHIASIRQSLDDANSSI